MAKRPTALKYTGFFKEHPSTLQDYFTQSDYVERKKSMKTLLSMLHANDMATAEKAFAESCERELINADSFVRYLQRAC